MKHKLLIAVLLIVAFGVLALVVVPQEPAQPQKVDQHWRVVADVPPVDLQRQLKLLNDAGVVVGREDIVIVGDKFTIMVCESQEDADEAENQEQAAR